MGLLENHAPCQLQIMMMMEQHFGFITVQEGPKIINKSNIIDISFSPGHG